jgi:hypothetical protein
LLQNPPANLIWLYYDDASVWCQHVGARENWLLWAGGILIEIGFFKSKNGRPEFKPWQGTTPKDLNGPSMGS